MLRPHTEALLVDYYESYLRDRDLERFRQSVAARYNEGTLSRLLQVGAIQARRAAVLALGLGACFEVNEVLAKALRDPDPAVRCLADNALWAIWFRADSPANNAALEQVRDLIARRRYEEAIEQATRLIGRAPRFAEVYNQRAIASFFLGRYVESSTDCRRVLERNPYHFGALSGLGQCYVQLDQRREALKIFRRALKLQPFSEGLRETVASLESEST